MSACSAVKTINIVKITTIDSEKNSDPQIELLKGMTFLRSTKDDKPEKQRSSQEEKIQKTAMSKKH